MEAQARMRPAKLQPVWTDHDSRSKYPRAAPYSTHGGPYSPSLRTPTMPSPLDTRSPGYDYPKRRHEQTMVDRTMVDRFDQRRLSPIEPHGNRGPIHSLPPITEANWERRRGSFASIPLPRAPAPTPTSPLPPMQLPRTRTLEDETRNMLLSGLPPPRPGLTASTPADLRRQSLPPATPTMRRNSDRMRQELRAWGHVFFGNGSDASCFVSAVALRRSSDSSLSDGSRTPTGPQGRTGNRVAIRARVRPCELGRKPFLIKREFNMDELRATIPETSPTSATEPRRLSVDPARLSPGQSKGFRRSSLAAGDASPVRSTNTVPIRMQHRSFILNKTNGSQTRVMLAPIFLFSPRSYTPDTSNPATSLIFPCRIPKCGPRRWLTSTPGRGN
ncbi:hypothetical protein OQA88_3547 [Cercophora sp. LCS_1]